MKLIFMLIALNAFVFSVEVVGDPLTCDFDLASSCQWMPDFRDRKVRWMLVDGRPRSNGIMCVRARRWHGRGRINARLWSPWVGTETKQHCLKFTYQMSESARLGILRHSEGSCDSVGQNSDGSYVLSHTCKSTRLWTSAKQTKVDWQSVAINLESSSDFKLILEGTIPEGNPDAKICVDNITSYARPCTELAASTSSSAFSWLEHMILIFAGALTLGLIIPIALLLVRVHRRKRRGKKMSRLSCVVVTGGDVVVPPQREGANALPNGREARNGVDAAGRLPAMSTGRSNAGAATAAANAAAAARRAPPPPPATAPPMPDDRSQPPSYPGSLERPPPRYEEAMGLLDDKVPTAEL